MEVREKLPEVGPDTNPNHSGLLLKGVQLCCNTGGVEGFRV